MSAIVTAGPATERVGALADQQQLDGVLLIGLENVQFAAAAALRSASELDRPNVLLIERNGRGCVFTSQETVSTVSIMAPHLHAIGYDERGATFPGGIFEEVATELARRWPAGARLGIEGDRMPIAVHDLLRTRVPDIELYPVHRALRQLRMVKSATDIAVMAEAAALTEQALRSTVNYARAGRTERHIADHLIAHMQADGFTTVDPLVGAGPNACRIGAPTTRVVEPGEWVRIDVKSRYRGYFYTDAGRMSVAGEPTQQQRDAYSDQYGLNLAIMDFLRPGVLCRDVYRYAQQVCAERGLRLFNYGHIGIGHGIGIGGTERPVLHEGDDTVIEAGMVINIEPNIYGPGDEILHLEDTLLITAAGVQPLSHLEDWSQLPCARTP